MKITKWKPRTKASRKSALIPPEVMKKASLIFDEVQEKGDRALFKWTWKLERHRISARTVMVKKEELEAALRNLPRKDLQVMKLAARRIRAYHRGQIEKGFRFADGEGTVIEERVVPLSRVGVCIPGGRYPLASTVLMTVIPARLAGVKEVVMVTPWPGGKGNDHVLAAARLAGADSVFKVGGVQAVAALACGTRSIPRVDKIVGPGSIWVTAGKAIAFSRGLCGIDSLAGPSEVVVAADESAPARWVAADLLSQAEHGEDSVALLVTPSRKLAREVNNELKLIVKEGPWPETALQRIQALLVKDREEAAAAVNQIAPEHLEIMMTKPREFLAKIENAASIFIGPHSPVPAGDYLAGANHVLPTGGTARFASPLGVQDFVKRQSVTSLSPRAMARLGPAVAEFASMEGLPAHGLSALARVKKPSSSRR